MEHKKIAIVGAGTSGYLSVLYFCTKYPHYNIHWIYPENNKPIGVGEGTAPQVREFFEELGITFKHIIKDIGGSLKLGVKFENFAPEDFFHPFGGPNPEPAEMIYMMEHDKIVEDIETKDIAFHMDIGNISNFLDDWFTRFKNLTIERKVVSSVDEVDCDWFIDCTGFQRAFINKYYPDNLVDVSDRIKNNKALVYRTDLPEHKRKIYTTCIGMNQGWIWNIPLKNKIGIGYVHNDQYDVKNEFLDYLEREGFGRPEVREVSMVIGRNKKHYKDLGNKHLVSIGLSSSFIEPMEATGLHFTTFSIKELDKLMHDEITSDEYENIINYDYDVTVDFIVAHYKFSHHSNDYWSFYKNIPIELYRQNSAFPVRSWNYILREYDKTPQLTTDQINQLDACKSYAEWLDEKKYYE